MRFPEENLQIVPHAHVGVFHLTGLQPEVCPHEMEISQGLILNYFPDLVSLQRGIMLSSGGHEIPYSLFTL